ncbi:hypothetical protein [Labrys wisconsinensis]|uniref:Uncharacterized protein n=1 Tax=Labrys wisconsinensis TaxID=425677 RepID=A0ABU0JJF1_9HYPH|nr:hypothetical protein [Labrys wisconsinensis]MDQ0474408.1 hypothetical protein [Labrys wisconsinensis]
MATVVALGMALAAALAVWKLVAPWKVRARRQVSHLGNGFSIMDLGITAERAPRSYEVAFYFTFKRKPQAGL